MRLLCAVIVLGLCSSTAWAEDWTTTDGKTYKDVTVIKHDAATVTILDADGGAAIPLEKLPADLQKKFGYDPVAAQKAIADEQAREAANDSLAAQVDAAEAQKKASSPQANTLIQNGDFSDGDTHWQGDGKTPQAYAGGSPAALTDPLTSKGLIVTLNSTSWTRIFQTFPTEKGTQYSIVVTYKLSPNLTLSKDAADYAGITKRIQIPGFENFGSLTAQPGQFYGTIGDPSSTTIAMEVYSPKLGSSDVQAYQHTYPPIPVSGSKTFALAFPPGAGTVVILSVAVTSN